MKIKKIIYLTFLTSAILSSCTNDDDHQGLPDTKKAVSFNTTITSNSVSRAVGDAWNEGDKVGIFMIPEGGTLATALAVNKKYSASASGELTYDSEDQAIYFPSDGSKVNFVTYYPYTTEINNNQIAIDVTNQSSQAGIDLLYAPTNTGFTNISGKVALKFTHQLTRMVLNITKASDVKLDNFGIKLLGTETKGTFDLATGTLTPSTQDVSEIAYKITDKGNNQLQAEAIVLPSNKLGDDASIEFTIGSQKFKQSLAGSNLNSASNYDYNVDISNNNGKPEVVVGTASITDWVSISGDDINIDLGSGTTDPDPTPTDPTTGVEQTIFAETFGTTAKIGKYWPGVNQFTGWDNSSLTFTDNYLDGSYSKASVRSTSTMDSHVWFASGYNSGLEISGFSTTGYTNLKLSYSITANKSGNQDVIQVKCGSTTMKVPSVDISTINTYQTVELSDLPADITSIEFISSADTNTAGYRIDNVKLVGTK
ncbi:fimbrillin family protein [uncultured Bacteroides sp.]|uniref:fimbrillin family protein n=1 Tax=uncultured Bacteroides sp. TaxID=162156 RepID=UPI002AAAF5EF|nr:fimbrillin family protein [uncultured Bacteroides sp.]